MAEGVIDRPTLIHGCELYYVKLPDLAPTKKVRVELLRDPSGRGTLQVVKRDGNTIEEIYTDKIGAACIITLPEPRQVLARRASRLCLIIFWKQSVEDDQPNDWRQLIIEDKGEKPAAYNCVQKLKAKLVETCQISTFPLSSAGPSDESSLEVASAVIKQDIELQFTRSYISIVPSDGTHNVERSEIQVRAFIKRITSEAIFMKHGGMLSLTVQRGDSASTQDYVTLIHPASVTPTHLVADRRTADQIDHEFSSREILRDRPLPIVAPSEVVDSDCGRPPRFEDPPFWFSEDDTRPSSIYGSRPPPISDIEPELYASKLRDHERRNRDVFGRGDSVRFKRFVDAVPVKPNMIELGPSAEDEHNQGLYGIPRISVSFDVDALINNFPEDNVESTFNSILNNRMPRHFHQVREACPFGMTAGERKKVCWRLDLIEHDIVNGAGWRMLAEKVMDLDNDDLEMINEFSVKYRYQVVEVLLDHWYKLYEMKSPKSIRPATKQTIIKVLNELRKYDLLTQMGWQYEQD